MSPACREERESVKQVPGGWAFQGAARPARAEAPRAGSLGSVTGQVPRLVQDGGLHGLLKDFGLPSEGNEKVWDRRVTRAAAWRSDFWGGGKGRKILLEGSGQEAGSTGLGAMGPGRRPCSGSFRGGTDPVSFEVEGEVPRLVPRTLPASCPRLRQGPQHQLGICCGMCRACDTS